MLEALGVAATRPLTAEDLMTWSAWVYPDEHFDRNGKPVLPHSFEIPGWRLIEVLEDPDSGYYGVAYFNPRTNQVVIANRGTDFTSLTPTRADEAAAIDIFRGRMTRQLQMAHDLLKKVWQVFRSRKEPPKFFATGHSLGGAAAQYQVAAGYGDKELHGMKIYGVTFAAVGATDVIQGMTTGPWRDPGSVSLRRIASDRLRNYVRVGDGFVYQRTGRNRRPARFGQEVLMAGLHMEDVEEAERKNRSYSDEPWPLSRPIRKGTLEWNYYENHSLKSYYSSDFVRPVDQIFSHDWDHYVE
jgi:hypothetical protein